MNGITLGALYGLAALSIVLLMRTTGVANMAAGNMGMMVAFVGFRLIVPLGIGLWPSFFVTIVIGAIFGAAVYVFIMLPNRQADRLNLTFRTIGFSLLLFALATRIWGRSQPFTVESLFGSSKVQILDFYVTNAQLGAILVALVCAAVLFLTLVRTPMGM